MNRRTFFRNCLAGAVLGLAKNLPMPAVGKVTEEGLFPERDIFPLPDFEDGTGLATANTYCSIDTADTYFAAYGASATWTAATDAQKKDALRRAAEYLEDVYGARWTRFPAHDFGGLS